MAKFSDIPTIGVFAYNGRHMIAKHSGGHCFISEHGTRDAAEQLQALVKIVEGGRKLRGVVTSAFSLWLG